MRPKFPSCLIVLTLLCGCQSPVEHWSQVAPGGSRWVAIEQVAPVPGSDELRPTLRLTLRSRWRFGGCVLLEGVPTLCGTDVRWVDDEHLSLRLPVDRAGGLRVANGASWAGVSVELEEHEDQVTLQSPSPDGALRLVVIRDCESEDWNLYLRRAGEPNYKDAMRKGWDDPDLFGGLGYNQPPLSLAWVGPRRARIQVPGKRYEVTLKSDLGGVHVEWVFKEQARPPAPPVQTLKPL